MDFRKQVPTFFTYKILISKIPLFNTIFKSLTRISLCCPAHKPGTASVSSEARHQCAHALCWIQTKTTHHAWPPVAAFSNSTSVLVPLSSRHCTGSKPYTVPLWPIALQVHNRRILQGRVSASCPLAYRGTQMIDEFMNFLGGGSGEHNKICL